MWNFLRGLSDELDQDFDKVLSRLEVVHDFNVELDSGSLVFQNTIEMEKGIVSQLIVFVISMRADDFKESSDDGVHLFLELL